MLTPNHSKQLAELATAMYSVNVTQRQIVNMILTNFKCTTKLYDDSQKGYLIKGVVTSFNKFPLKMDFYAPVNSVERQLFVKKPTNDEDTADLQFECSLSAHGKMVSSNYLTISSAKLKELGLED